MKTKEWSEGLDHLDPALVESYVLEKDRLRQKNRRPAGLWLRVGVIAACLVLMIGAVLALPLFREDPGEVIPPDTEMGGPDAGDPERPVSPGTSAGQETGESLPADDPTPDYAFYVYISDERYVDAYQLAENAMFCEPAYVGALVGEMTLTASFGPNHVRDVTADVYEVIGADEELCLCIRYRDDGGDDFVHDFLVHEAYHFVHAKTYSFSSLGGMREILPQGYGPNYVNYYGQAATEQYFLNDNVREGLGQLILSADGSCVDTEGGKTLDRLIKESRESLSTSFHFDGRIGRVSGQIHVFDSGYLYYSAFGGQIFEIGVESARNMMEYVLRNGTTESYDWIERDGVLYPVFFDEDAEYATFVEALYETKLWGQIWFTDTVIYWENVFGATHHEGVLSRKALTGIAQVLSEDTVNLLGEGEGRAVDNKQVPGFEPHELLFNHVEAAVFTHTWDAEGESTYEITVYDSGIVCLQGVYYYIGTNFTNGILDTVRFEFGVNTD